MHEALIKAAEDEIFDRAMEVVGEPYCDPMEFLCDDYDTEPGE